MPKCFDIGNEYDLQHIVYALLRAVFPLCRIEEYQDAGACAVRKDICIEEFDIAIELKCTRDKECVICVYLIVWTGLLTSFKLDRSFTGDSFESAYKVT